MPKPEKQPKRPRDVNQWARQILQESTHKNEAPPAESPATMHANPPSTAIQISAYMAQIGSKGGKIGGKRRLVTMTARERKSVAKKAAMARWAAR